jgi:hypothetical protein
MPDSGSSQPASSTRTGHGCARGVAGAPRRDGERMLRRRHLHLRALSRMPARGRRTETPVSPPLRVELYASSSARRVRACPAAQYLAENAPSDCSSCPEIQRPSSDTRNSTTAAMSPGRPRRPERCHLRQPAARLVVVHPAGVDGPGVEHVRRDAARAELAGRRDHEPVESALGGPVGEVAGHVVAGERHDRTSAVAPPAARRPRSAADSPSRSRRRADRSSRPSCRGCRIPHRARGSG